MRYRVLYFVICLILTGCSEKKPEIIYKYSSRPAFLTCENLNAPLFQEALHNFEANLSENYSRKNPNLTYSYRQFINESVRNRANYNNLSTEHSLNIFEALKAEEGLWLSEGETLALNYDHEIFQCIADNIADKDIKATFNALLSTNSMSFRMLKDVLVSKSSRMNSDKFLATYVALELYYSKLSDVDLSKKEPVSSETPKDPHAGHNH